jgi:hypothetical protein
VTRHLRLVAAAAALVLAVLLALLARDVRRWEASVEEGDRRFQVSPAAEDLWQPDGRTAGGLTRTLLAIDDDLKLREAGQLLRRSRPRATSRRTPGQIALATSARVGLAEVQNGDYSRELRSIAANEIGTLAFADALSDPFQAAEHARRGVQKFTEAVRLDPENEAAMVNLELLLTLRRGQDPRVDPAGVTSRGSGAASGAGAGGGGSGF